MTSLKNHKRVQQPRGTTALNDAYIGPIGQFTIDTDRMEIRLHDGSTPGGHRITNLANLYSLFVSADSEAGALEFDVGELGFVTRIGNKVYALRKLTAEDGITLVNADGKDGDPLIGLPDRLDEIASEVTDADLAMLSGFYKLEANAKNLPAELPGGDGATMVTVAYSETNVVQFLFSLASQPLVFRRSMTKGLWGSWWEVSPYEGTLALLRKGEDMKQRTWSARDLDAWLDRRLEDIAKEDSGGAQAVYTVRKMFSINAPDGIDRTPVLKGPYTFANGDRGIIVSCNDSANSGAVAVDCAIEMKIGGSWETVAQKRSTTAVNGDADTSKQLVAGSVTCRFVKNASSVDICDEEWGILKTYTGAWSGEVRVNVSQKSPSTLTKYKLKV